MYEFLKDYILRSGSEAQQFRRGNDDREPVRELKGYQKVTLNPGEQKNVTFAIEEKQLRFITENGIWESEPGEFEVFVGTDSTTENGMHFWLVK